MFGPPRSCPVCNGFEFRPSKSGLLRILALPIMLRPFRCYACNGRVWRFSLSGKPLGKRWKSSVQVRPVAVQGDTPIESAAQSAG